MSKYIDLIAALPAEDKVKIERYISLYGCRTNFIGVDTWLQNWSHSNQKLYKLLGNSFIKEYPYSYKRSKSDIWEDMKDLIANSDFKTNYNKFYFDHIRRVVLNIKPDELKLLSDEELKIKNFFNHLLDINNLVDNKIIFGIKWKKPGANKMLQVQPGAKPLKALYRVIEYFKDDWDWDLLAFDEFKKQFGIIVSDSEIKGKACISIHPLDYMTMSDNASHWESCMNWRDHGCYHVGTVEMMNSNNTLCCYLVNTQTPFTFCKTDKNTGEVIFSEEWNNKKWRSLYYFNKDIIMGGKPYPYDSKELTIFLLDKIKELAKENLNYSYAYGPELYQDMIHIDRLSRMEKQRDWMVAKSRLKKNIIWDTKGMYNDMLNDNKREYYCYRNPVNSTKIISVSGKANCLCCNNSVLKEQDVYDYNERFYNVDSIVCNDCKDTYFTCNACGARNEFAPLLTLANGQRVCEFCAEDFYHCSCCNKIFNVRNIRHSNHYYFNNYLYNDIIEKKVNFDEVSRDRNFYSTGTINESLEKSNEDLKNNYFDKKDSIMLEKTLICQDCLEKNKKLLDENSVYFGEQKGWYLITKINILEPSFGEKFRYCNASKASLKEIKKLELDLAS